MSLNIAHRGYSGKYPENTMMSFENAVIEKCDGIETDVQLTRDGEMVLCHDELLERTTDGSGLLVNYTFNELRKLNASVNFKNTNEKIPTLKELLDLAKESEIILNLELKNSVIEYKGLEEKVIDLVHSYGLQDKIIISSFNHYSVKKCKEISPDLQCGILYESVIYNVGSYAKSLGVDACHPNFYTLKPYIVEEIKKNGLKINAYTVNEEEYMEMMIAMGIDGIITNYPNILNRLLKK
jgi:glycerophosphoryl diester phosphodiesterase